MDWTHLISGVLGFIPFIVNLFINKRKRQSERVKDAVESTDILKASSARCYKELTELRTMYVKQERKLMEIELLVLRYEGKSKAKNDTVPHPESDKRDRGSD